MVYVGNIVGLTLLRHGLTQENIDKRYIGWYDAVLSEEGKHQLRHYTGYPEGDYFIISDLKRAIETMEIIYPNQPYEMSMRIRELSFGDFEGKTYEQLKDKPLYRQWIDQMDIMKAPNGESLTDLRQRVNRQLWDTLQLAKEKGMSNVVFITHGGVIRHILSQYANVTIPFWEWKIPHGSATQTNWTENSKGEWQCISYQGVPLTERKRR